ncbi:MAG: hypothetical protein NT067_02375 [Candidatus Diapherotrites archaeon]|nr:hypothetical protein [Candidatus Diapherotrites archaeon]
MPVKHPVKEARNAILRRQGLARIGRPEGLRAPERLKLEMKNRTELSELGRQGEWPYFKIPLGELEYFSGIKLENLARKKILGLRKGEKFVVLDIGCGAGQMLADFKALFGPQIRTIGTVFEKTHGEEYRGVNRLIEGAITEINPHEKANLVIGYQGAHHHTELKSTALEKTIGWMKPGATAVIHIGWYAKEMESNPEGIRAKERELFTVLRANGIKKWQYKNGFLVFVKPKPRLPK